MKNIILNKIQGSRFFVSHITILVFFLQFNCHVMGDTERKSSEQMLSSVINIGVIQNLNSNFGTMINLCIEMAKSDFYSAHPNYKTRLGLRTKDVQDVLDVDLAVWELLEFEQVHGILGHHGPTKELFVTELGRKAHVPIISFTARSSALSNMENQYFVRTAFDDAVQARGLAAICHGFEWKKVVVLYEDSKYGHQFLSHLKKAFQDVDIGLAYLIAIPVSANKTHLYNKLSILKENQTIKVYLVHMSASLGSRLFALANEIGMMSEGHAWIITDNLSIFLNSMDPATRDSMDGVLGIRPYVPFSKDLENFQERWIRNSSILKRTTGSIMDLNVYGLWAYDTVTALAIALEKIGPVNLSSLYEKTTKRMNLRISSFGRRLLSELLSTRFRGLSGDFELVDGKRKPSAFEILNVIGTGERRVGFWTPDRGIIGEISSSGEATYSTSIKELKNVMWPGDAVTRPKGWAIPPTGPLRVGVPWKQGYTEFVKILSIDDKTDKAHATGFAIDIFLAALKVLPFPVNYTFLCYNGMNDTSWSYDDMLRRIPTMNFDMVVGDTTILAPRASYVDFSLPYSESGVVLLINNRKGFDMWSFTKPLRWDLWLAILVSCILMGITIWILERRVTNLAPDERPRMIYLAPIAVLAFQERNMVSNKWSFFILVCWLFMAFVLMQSFTANLSAILTVDQLIESPLNIGFQEGSFVKNILINGTNFHKSRLRSYYSLKEFHDAMRRGSKNGGIDAIIDETPYMKLFMSRYDPKYKVVGQPSNYKIVQLLYRTEGLGFAFPLGSPLAAYFSRAILNVTQGPEMASIEQKNFGPGYSSQHPLSSVVSQGTSSLSFDDFAGLFIIVGLVTVFAVICSETPILSILSNVTRQFLHNCGIIINVDGGTTNPEENANIAAIPRADSDEQHNGEQHTEPPEDGDHEETVEMVALNNEADDVQDVGGETNSHLARNF